MPNTVVSVLHAFSHLVFIVVLWHLLLVMNKWGLERCVNVVKISGYLVVELGFKARPADFGDINFSAIQ